MGRNRRGPVPERMQTGPPAAGKFSNLQRIDNGSEVSHCGGIAKGLTLGVEKHGIAGRGGAETLSFPEVYAKLARRSWMDRNNPDLWNLASRIKILGGFVSVLTSSRVNPRPSDARRPVHASKPMRVESACCRRDPGAHSSWVACSIPAMSTSEYRKGFGRGTEGDPWTGNRIWKRALQVPLRSNAGVSAEAAVRAVRHCVGPWSRPNPLPSAPAAAAPAESTCARPTFSAHRPTIRRIGRSG